MSVRILNECYRLMLTTCMWRKLSTTAFYQSSKKWTKDENRESMKERDEIGKDLKTAVKSLAESLPGDQKQTESDLLGQLLQQTLTRSKQIREEPVATRTTRTLSRKYPVPELRPDIKRPSESNILSKVLGQIIKDDPQGTADEQSSDTVLSTMNIIKDEKRLHVERKQGSNRMGRAISTEYELFEGPGLDLFTKATDTQEPTPRSYDRTQTLLHQLEQENTVRLNSLPPANGFEEMVQWTNEGKLWTFPINNEAGMQEEENVGFYEHVFLEDNIADFPRKGPIRHFMELVVVGLSKNPYLTVKEKHSHIDWFRNYFQEKESVLRESLGDASKFSEIEQQT